MKHLLLALILLGSVASIAHVHPNLKIKNGAYIVSEATGFPKTNTSCDRAFTYSKEANFIESAPIANQETLMACPDIEAEPTVFLCNQGDDRMSCISRDGESRLIVNDDEIILLPTDRTTNNPYSIKFKFISDEVKKAKFFSYAYLSGFTWYQKNSICNIEDKNSSDKASLYCSDITAEILLNNGICSKAEELSRQMGVMMCHHKGYKDCKISEKRDFVYEIDKYHAYCGGRVTIEGTN